MIDETVIHKAQVLRLKIWPETILQKPCHDFEDDYIFRKRLAADMIKTMRAHNGVGLAAPQIGYLRRMFVVGVAGSPLVFVNPILSFPDTDTTYRTEEGCLSVPGYSEDRSRHAIVEVAYEDVDGHNHIRQFHNMEAFVIQHENDHLNGNLFIDNLSRLKLDRVKRKVKKSLRK